jgi:predicted Zn-dependent protease
MRHDKTRAKTPPPPSWPTALLGLSIGLLIAFALSYARRPAAPAAPPRPAASALSPEALRHLQLGQQRLKESRLHEGLREIEEAQRLAPDSPDVLHSLGQACLLLKRFETAAGHLRRALAQAPGEVRILVDLALALRELGQAREAVEVAERAVALAPGERRLQVLLGQNLLRANEPRRAVVVFKALVGRGEADANDYLALARALDLLNQSDPAQSAFRRALELDPGLPLAHHWYSQHLMRTGKREAAEAEIAAYKKANALQTRIAFLEARVQIDPKNVRFWTDLAAARLERGRPKLAQQALDRAAEVAPEDAQVRKVRAALDRAQDRGR